MVKSFTTDVKSWPEVQSIYLIFCVYSLYFPKAKDIDKVRSLLSESRAESLELCVRSRMSAAPKLYAQIGYRFMWWFHTPWWLCTPLQYAAIHDTISGDITVALIRSGADVNNCGSLQASPLHIAAATKNKVFIQALVNHRTPNSMHVDLELQDVLFYPKAFQMFYSYAIMLTWCIGRLRDWMVDWRCYDIVFRWWGKSSNNNKMKLGLSQ